MPENPHHSPADAAKFRVSEYFYATYFAMLEGTVDMNDITSPRTCLGQ
jgi:hypothetical protein